MPRPNCQWRLKVSPVTDTHDAVARHTAPRITASPARSVSAQRKGSLGAFGTTARVRWAAGRASTCVLRPPGSAAITVVRSGSIGMRHGPGAREREHPRPAPRGDAQRCYACTFEDTLSPAGTPRAVRLMLDPRGAVFPYRRGILTSGSRTACRLRAVWLPNEVPPMNIRGSRQRSVDGRAANPDLTTVVDFASVRSIRSGLRDVCGRTVTSWPGVLRQGG